MGDACLGIRVGSTVALYHIEHFPLYDLADPALFPHICIDI
jgi:hypothetical protein